MKKMLKYVFAMRGRRIVRLGATFLMIFFLTSFICTVTEPFRDRMMSYFDRLNRIQQEKLYLHFDKPYYSAGEKMWFKGYLLNAATHQQTLTNFIYVEMIDPKGEVKIRKKIKRADSLGFAGYITIPAEFQASQYTIRAYTSWMRNFDPLFFYSRNFVIGNAIANKILSESTFETEEDGRMSATVRFFDAQENPYSKIRIKATVIDSVGRRVQEDFQTTDENGRIKLKLKRNTFEEKRPYLNVQFVDDQYTYEQNIYFPHVGNEYALSFFPEGGTFVPGVDQVVAFKAQHENGFSEQVSGWVCNSRGDTLTPFKTLYDGMGFFNLIPEKGERYHVVARSDKGVEKRFDLPDVAEKGFSLAVLPHGDNVMYRVEASDSSLWNHFDSLYLVVHTRGIPVYLRSVSSSESVGIFNTESMNEGISHLLLFDETGRPLCERLFFVRHQRPAATWRVFSDKSRYGKREKVRLEVALIDTLGQPVKGDFSLSVTDRSTVIPDSLSDHILSHLLLTSDIRGYIDRPGAYFLQNNRKTKKMLDLVMMTHGWRRFNISLDDTIRTEIKYFIEKGQYMTGNIRRGLIGGVPKEGTVSLMIPDQQLFRQTVVNPDGTFMLDGLDYKDSANVLLQGRTRKGGGHVAVTLDAETFPGVLLKNPFSHTLSGLSDVYMQNVRDKYFDEGGVPVFHLKEVVVTADRSAIKESGYKGINDYSITGTEMKDKHIPHLYNAILRLPGVFLQPDGTVSVYNKPAAVFIDNLEMDLSDVSWLEGIPIDDVNNIEVIKDEPSMAFIHSENPDAKSAILIFLKETYKQDPHISLGFTKVLSLGYNKCVEFYSPVYDTPDKKKGTSADFRSTVYWSPRIECDSLGKAHIEFYTTDRPDHYRVTIEGLSDRGEPYRYDKDL